MVQLKAPKNQLSNDRLICFNSKMVQLKVVRQIKYKQQCTFQFQNGTIKSDTRHLHSTAWTSFNSKMVQLKGSSRKAGAFSLRGFNSKMVQLKVILHLKPKIWHTRFNSKMVQLKGCMERFAGKLLTVSIPKWYN